MHVWGEKKRGDEDLNGDCPLPQNNAGFDTKEIKKYKFTNLLTRCDTQFAFCNWFLALLALGPTGCGILEVVGRAFDYCVHGGCCVVGDDSECDMIGAPPLLFIRDVRLFQRSWRLLRSVVCVE